MNKDSSYSMLWLRIKESPKVSKICSLARLSIPLRGVRFGT